MEIHEEKILLTFCFEGPKHVMFGRAYMLWHLTGPARTHHDEPKNHNAALAPTKSSLTIQNTPRTCTPALEVVRLPQQDTALPGSVQYSTPCNRITVRTSFISSPVRLDLVKPLSHERYQPGPLVSRCWLQQSSLWVDVAPPHMLRTSYFFFTW